jgi:hypothetical protein
MTRAPASELHIEKFAGSDLWHVGAMYAQIERSPLNTGRDVLRVSLARQIVAPEELEALARIVRTLAPFVHAGFARPELVAFSGTLAQYEAQGQEVAAALHLPDAQGEGFGGGSFEGNFGGTD